MRTMNDVIAGQRADGNKDALDRRAGVRRNPVQHRAEFRFDGPECCFAVADQVHLVHGHNHVANAQQRRDVSVTPGLDEHALARVDEHHGRIGGRSAGGHVARVLLMPRRVRNDKLAPRRGEVTVSHIDRDALFALRAQPVGKQRKIDLARRCGSLPFDRAHLVFVDRLRVIEQPADERGFSVVHAAGRRKSQQVLSALLAQKLPNLKSRS